MSFHVVNANGSTPLLSVELDVTNAPTNATRVWTDVTADVLSLSYTLAGRNDELQRTSPGTLNAVLANQTAKYDPGNIGGVGVKRRQWIRVRAQWAGVTYPRWQGIIETITQGWPSAGHEATATISAASALKVANLYDLAGQTFSSQFSSARVSAVAALLGLSTAIADTGASTLVAVSTAMPAGSFASSHLQAVEESENGLVFDDAQGRLAFQSRYYRAVSQGTPVATIGENASEIPYTDATQASTDDAYIFNAAAVTPTNADGSTGTTQTASNASSETAYFTSTLNRTILVSSTTEAASCAQYLVGRYGDPPARIPLVEVLGMASTSKWPTILGAFNSQRFTFKRRAAVTISQDVHIEQIAETIEPGSWRTTFQLSPATTFVGWVLGDAVNGLLGQTTFLTY